MNDGDGDDTLGNPVGELQEMTQKRLWPPPTYEFTSEQGPPHAREFICTVRLINLIETREYGFECNGLSFNLISSKFD